MPPQTHETVDYSKWDHFDDDDDLHMIHLCFKTTGLSSNTKTRKVKKTPSIRNIGY